MERCEKLVNFAAAAIARAGAGQPFKVLLGLADPEWHNMCGHMLKAISGGAVQIQVAETLSQFIEAANGGQFDLGFLAPGLLRQEPTAVEGADAWTSALLAVQGIKRQQAMRLVLVGTAGDLARHKTASPGWGGDAVLEINNQTAALVDTAIRLLTLKSLAN